MTDRDLADHVHAVRETGYTVLRGVLSRAVVDDLLAVFWPTYERHVAANRDKPNRGPMRHYISLPFAPPFYQPAFHGNADMAAIVRKVLGENVYCAQYASDTPAKGSVHQDWHSDVGPLFPDYDECLLPPSLIAVNTPLVDVGPDNGPFEVCDGSHRIAGAIEKLNAGELPFHPLYMSAGDVLIRDPRCIHRGSPNSTDTPRPMLVLGFDRGNHRRAGHINENRIAADFYSSLSHSEQLLYRVIPQT